MYPECHRVTGVVSESGIACDQIVTPVDDQRPVEILADLRMNRRLVAHATKKKRPSTV